MTFASSTQVQLLVRAEVIEKFGGTIERNDLCVGKSASCSSNQALFVARISQQISQSALAHCVHSNLLLTSFEHDEQDFTRSCSML